MLRPANPHIICVAYCHIMRFAIYVTVSDVLVTTSIDLCVYRARFCCPGSPFRLFLSNRDRNTLEKSPIRPYRTISAITHRRNSGLLDLHTLSAHGMVCPGSQKEAKITNRDNEIWPGSHVNRLPPPPGHRLRIDKMLQCLTGMRLYRDSNVSLEVEESSSTPNRKYGGTPAMLRQHRNLRCMMRPKTKKPGGGGRRVREKREEGLWGSEEPRHRYELHSVDIFYITVSFLGIRCACLRKVLANCDGFVTPPDNRPRIVGA